MIMSDAMQVETQVESAQQTRPARKPDPQTPPPYHVVLLDDNDHSYDYVVRMLVDLFRHSIQTAFRMACEVDATGRVIVETTTRERAEFKQEQVHAFGADPHLERCAGSMSAIIEPAM
jgi:ATP-dependent Clp protease adaptor protein ClpS